MVRRKIQPRHFLIAGLALLWLRNAPLALFLPLWSHGDEIGYLDYAMKIGRGHLPRVDEFIEPAVFRLHKARYDGRYISPHRSMRFVMPRDLGLAAYSYEAQQPPLPMLVFAAFRLPLKAVGLPLLIQVKALRLVGLLIVSAGLLLLYASFRRRKDLRLFWYAPLLLIPLLSQDMFVSINTDVFAFLGGAGVVGAIVLLFERPLSAGRWALLAAATGTAMWMKVTGLLFFALWPILALTLGRTVAGSRNRRKLAALAAGFFILAGILASPWYVRNYLQGSHALGYPLKGQEGVPFKPLSSPPLDWSQIKTFKNAFGRTLMRGELLWNGGYLTGFSPWVEKILQDILFWIFFAAGFAAVVFPLSRSEIEANRMYFILAAAGAGMIAGMLVLHFGWGGISYYLARYSFAGLYPIMLVFSGGCRRVIPEDRLAVALPALALLGYNAAYTYRLIIRVLD